MEALALLLKFQINLWLTVFQKNLVIRKNRRTEYVSIHKGWLIKTMYLWILFCIYARLLYFFLSLYRSHFWNCSWQPAHLVKVWLVFWNHGHCMGEMHGLSLMEGLWFFSPLPSTKWLYASKSWRKGRAISCVTSAVHICWVSLLSPYSANPPPKNQKLLHFRNTWRRILGRGSQNPTIVRKFLLCFILGLSPFPPCLEFRGL